MKIDTMQDNYSGMTTIFETVLDGKEVIAAIDNVFLGLRKSRALYLLRRKEHIKRRVKHVQVISGSGEEHLLHEVYLRRARMLTKPTLKSPAHKIICVAQAYGSDAVIPGGRDGTQLDAFGVEVGALRREQGYSLDELAEKAKVDVDDLFAIELGIAPVPRIVELLPMIGNALGNKYQYLSDLFVQLVIGG